MIFGACELIVLRSLPYAPGPAFSPTISLALTYFAYSALTSASVMPGGGVWRGAASRGGWRCGGGVLTSSSRERAIGCVARGGGGVRSVWPSRSALGGGGWTGIGCDTRCAGCDGRCAGA